MTDERWREVMRNQDAKLTPEELKAGWHFCNEWDGLLVGPGMEEGQCCTCFPENDPRRLSVRG